MGVEQKTKFTIDKSKCIKCGRCINTCSGMLIVFGEDGYPQMKSFERFGWRGCWRCQHCLAVCPVGAISIFGKKPENSMQVPPTEMGTYMEQLVTNRRSCRRFLDKDVDPEAREMLGIPKDHYTGLIVGFGYPEIPYARGVQKDGRRKIHRYRTE